MQLDRTNGAAVVPPPGAPDRTVVNLTAGRVPDGTRDERVPARTEPTQGAGQAGGDAVGALRWGLRRYVWLVVLCVLTVTVLVPAYVTTRPVEYQAEALVVAQRLDMSLVALPRFGESVFTNGQVARSINATLGGAGDAAAVVPERVSLVAEQDSIVFQVIGHDPSPATAAALANRAAETFTAQLNGPGDGVGLFALQSRAEPPAEPTEQLPSLRVLLPIALSAGLVLGLAAVAALLVIRRPVLDAAGAVEATGVPVLGSVTLPRTRENDFPGLQEMSGVVPLCRRLLAAGVGPIVLVGPDGPARGRGQLIVAMSYVLGLVVRIRLVVDSHVAAAAEAYAGHPEHEHSSPPPTGGRPELTLVDGTHRLDAGQIAGDALTVLVVASGTSTSTLRAAVTEHLGDAGNGRLLMLHERRSRRGSPWSEMFKRPRTAEAAPGPDAAEADRAQPAES